MNFICITKTCAISISKASFPMAMNCPVCQNPLDEEIIQSTISEDEQLLISKLPYVIAYPYKRMLEETDGRNKLELLAYTFLNGLKYLGLVTASEYFNSSLKSAKLNELYRNNLFQPSFGNWNAFLREATHYLDSENARLVFPEIKEIYKKIELAKSAKKYKTESQFTDENGQVAWKKSELTSIGLLINFRNRYLGHGAPLSTEEYKSLYHSTYPVLIDFLSEWKGLEGISMIRYDAKESWEMMGAEISLISDNSPIKKSNVCLSHLDGRNLELIPFYVLPKQFTAGASDKVQIQVYEQNTGQRVVFYSPESIKSEASGEILERLKILLDKKEQAEYFTPEQFSNEILLNQIHIYNEKTRSGLIKEKKLLEGIYQPRIDAETELLGWVSAKAGLFMIASEAGSGKTNLLSHMVTKYENAGYSSILIRSIRTEETNIEKEIKEILNVNDDFDLPLFLSTHFTQENPLIILIDGGNEHQGPQEFLESILQFVSKSEIGSVKIVLSWRISTLNDLPYIDEIYKTILYEVGEREEEALEANRAFLLKGLNKIEIEGAWRFYLSHTSKSYRPNFSFRDLLAFDPLLIEELSNPLLLRLFMELYSGKSLPKASKGFINLWELWWKEIQKDHNQSKYLALLASYMIRKNSLQVSLDELFDVPQLSDAVKNIQIDSPHQQLIRKGILSQFFQHDTLQVSFTMEASFHYVVSRNLELDLALKQLENNSIWKESIKYFLWDKAANKEDLLLFKLIDLKGFPNDLAALALSQRINLFGAEETLNHLFLHESKDDWNVLEEAFRFIKKSRPKIVTDFADQILDHCKSGLNEDNCIFVIELLSESTKLKADIFYEQFIIKENLEDVLQIIALAKYFTKFGNHKVSAELLNKAIILLPENSSLMGVILETLIDLQLILWNQTSAWQLIINAELFYKNKLIYCPKVEGRILNLKGAVKQKQGLFSEALEYYQNAFNLNKANLGPFHHETIRTLIKQGDIHSHFGNYDLALEEYQKSLANNIQFYGDSSFNVAVLLNRIGDISNHKGDYDNALENYERAEAIHVQNFGESHPNVAMSLERNGDIWETKGDYDNALEYYERAMAIRLQYFGETHPDIAASLGRIGGIWQIKGDFDKALNYYERAMSIQVQYFGETHPDIAASLGRIGGIWQIKGDFDKALNYYERAMSIQVQYFGETHPDIAASLSRIGGIWQIKGDYDKALNYYERAMSIQVQYFGETHPYVAASLDRIGDISEIKGDFDKALNYYERIWQIKGDFDKALNYYERAMAIRLQYYGESHPDIAASLSRIGDISNNKGDYSNAYLNYTNSLNMFENNFGGNHPKVGVLKKNVGKALIDLGDLKKAKEMLDSSVTILLQNQVESDPQLARTYLCLAKCLRLLNKLNVAEENIDLAIEIFETNFGDSHVETTNAYFEKIYLSMTMGNDYDATLDRIGDISKIKGDYDDALVNYVLSMAIRVQYYGESHPNVAASLSRIGDIWETKGDYSNAYLNYTNSLNIFENNFGGNHPDVGQLKGNVGKALIGLGDLNKAKEILDSSVMILLQNQVESDPKLARTYLILAKCHRLLKNIKSAMEIIEKAKEIFEMNFGDTHIETANAYFEKGLILAEINNEIDAQLYFKKCYDIRFEILRPEHVDTIEVQKKLNK